MPVTLYQHTEILYLHIELTIFNGLPPKPNFMQFKDLQKSILILALFCATSFVGNASIFYVDQSNVSGTEDGITWATAFTDLQAALTHSALAFGDEIHVAQGTYNPSSVADPDVSFELVDGVEIKGGFPSGGGVRNPIANTTVLDGAGISYSVIYSNGVSAATVLDGFTITGGQASGICSDGSSSSRQKFGGGWFNINGSPRVNYCIFDGNSSSCNGGAIYNDGGAGKTCDPVFTNCEFNNNYGDLAGGAIYNNGNGGTATTTFYNCKIISNGTNRTYTTYGAAIYNLGKNGNANSLFVNCVLAHNSGFAGGSIYNLGSDGGQASPTVINCLFFGNDAELSAGALYTNAGNTPGGGTSVANIQNSIFWNNVAGQFGGDIFKNNNGVINLTECIIDAADCTEGAAGNTDPTCISGVQFNEDPMLADPYNDDFSLTANSAAINEGDNSINPLPMDLNGMSRIQQSTIDLGPIESPFVALAIELIDFNAQILGEEVIVEWSTLFEINHDVFEVEKSTDGINFSTIGTQKGLNKDGVKTIYSFVDKFPAQGTNYYRIKSIDFSKNNKLSSTRNVVFSINNISIFPNPTADYINIQASTTIKSDIEYVVINAQGQTMTNGIIQSRNYELLERIEIPAQWNPGLYFIVLDPTKMPNSTPLKFNILRSK